MTAVESAAIWHYTHILLMRAAMGWKLAVGRLRLYAAVLRKRQLSHDTWAQTKVRKHPARLRYQQLMVTRFAASLRTNNSPQPKETQPRFSRSDFRLIRLLAYDSSAHLMVRRRQLTANFLIL